MAAHHALATGRGAAAFTNVDVYQRLTPPDQQRATATCFIAPRRKFCDKSGRGRPPAAPPPGPEINIFKGAGAGGRGELSSSTLYAASQGRRPLLSNPRLTVAQAWHARRHR